MTRVLALCSVLIVTVILVPVAARAADPEFPLTIENHRFTPEEIKVKAGAPFILIISNKDGSPEEFEIRSLRIEKVVPGGKTMRVRMPSLKPGTHEFIGEYNEKTAKGRIVAE